MLHTDYTDLVYSQAIALCQVSGAQIAAFETKLEHEAAKPHLAMPVYISYWLNANDKRHEGKLTDHIFSFDLSRT